MGRRQCCRLGLVDHEDIDLPEQLDRERPGGRGVEDDACTQPSRASDQRCVGALGNLVLQDQGRRGRERGVGHRIRIGPRVGARGDHDAVLAVRVDEDRRAPRSLIDARHPAQVDAAGNKQLERGIGECIVPDRTEEPYCRAGACGGQRLIGALAAGICRKRFGGERLPRGREASDAGDQIEVDRAENDDHHHRGGV